MVLFELSTQVTVRDTLRSNRRAKPAYSFQAELLRQVGFAKL